MVDALETFYQFLEPDLLWSDTPPIISDWDFSKYIKEIGVYSTTTKPMMNSKKSW